LGIGVFGRVRPDKGTDVFVDALCRVLPQHPQATAVIAGLVQPRYQAYADELRQRIATAGLSERILWLGEVPADQIALWYQRCTIAVACPREEPFGLTPFEAAATGCALVCSRTGAFPDLVQDGINGYLVPTGDAPALAHALTQFLNDPTRTLQMGQQAAQVVRQHFSLAAEAQGIAEVYRRLWAGKG
jgi:mannosyltransferase